MFINITFSITNEAIPLNLTKIYLQADYKFTSKLSELKDDEILDDFKDIYNPIGIRILFLFFWTICMTISNAFWLFMALYEKYGEDIMKRSINNHLLSQLCLAMVLYNCVYSTMFLSRHSISKGSSRIYPFM
jgi:hypothetical protein